MTLRIHLGYMAEEVSAKLKPRLRSLDLNAESVLVVTRDQFVSDDPYANTLFEQSILRYEGLLAAINDHRWAETFQPDPVPAEEVNTIPRNIVTQMAHFLDFNANTYANTHPNVKYKMAHKLTQEGKQPRLTVLQIGASARITDIFIQLPEMGYQSTLATKIIKGILSGLFEWLHRDNTQSRDLKFYAFGAGGAIAIRTNDKIGDIDEVKGVLSLRSLLKGRSLPELVAPELPLAPELPVSPYEGDYRAKFAIRFFGSYSRYDRIYNRAQRERPNEFSLAIKEKDNHFFSQEAMRFFLIMLAHHRHHQLTEGQVRQGQYRIDADGALFSYQFSYQFSSDYSNAIQRDRPTLYQVQRAAQTDVALALDPNLLYVDLTAAMQALQKAEEDIQIEEQARRVLLADALLQRIPLDEWQGVCERINAQAPQASSCSASMFFDESMKSACRLLLGNKAIDANMEDDLIVKVEKHVLKLKERHNAHNAGASFLLSFECRRVHCDPSDIPLELNPVFIGWADQKRMTLNNYVDAVIWGASGFDSRYLPPSAAWGIGNLAFQHRGYKTTCNNGEKIIIDPFWREIATDLVQDIRGDKAFNERFPGPEKPAMRGAFSAIRNSLMSWNTEAPIGPILRAQLGQQLTQFLQGSGLWGDDGEACNVWIRKGSWGGNETQQLDQLVAPMIGVPEAIGAVFDRAFYVSANIPALMDQGEERISEILENSGSKTFRNTCTMQ